MINTDTHTLEAHQSSFSKEWSQHEIEDRNKYFDWLIRTKWKPDWFISMLIWAEEPLQLRNRTPDNYFSSVSSLLSHCINIWYRFWLYFYQTTTWLPKTFINILNTTMSFNGVGKIWCYMQVLLPASPFKLIFFGFIAYGRNTRICTWDGVQGLD